LSPRQFGNQSKSKACKSYDLQAFTFFINQFDLNNFNENDLCSKIRHTYDIYQLLQNPASADFFQSDDFDKMLHRGATDDIVSFKNNNQWLKQHPVD